MTKAITIVHGGDCIWEPMHDHEMEIFKHFSNGCEKIYGTYEFCAIAELHGYEVVQRHIPNMERQK